jgi:2-polyprenyl-3-methyl-5-hydroxy-6-metoxy-1,4-benzoquinol methylase
MTSSPLSWLAEHRLDYPLPFRVRLSPFLCPQLSGHLLFGEVLLPAASRNRGCRFENSLSIVDHNCEDWSSDSHLQGTALMATDYNQGQIAEQYKKSKEQPWRSRIEAHSLMNRIGEVSGKKVVDIACGEGHITRQLRQAGANHVLGVDISERMIELAREQEAHRPLGIEYRVGDARSIISQQDFELAVSAWLLVYARDRDELALMCRGLACWLKPGGRFVTFTTNPDVYHFPSRQDYSKYGFEVLLEDDVCEGASITWRFQQEGAPLDIENYYLPLSAYQSAFQEAGFQDFAVRPLELSPHPDGEDDRNFWSQLLDFPPAILMECVRT